MRLSSLHVKSFLEVHHRTKGFRHNYLGYATSLQVKGHWPKKAGTPCPGTTPPSLMKPQFCSKQ